MSLPGVLECRLALEPICVLRRSTTQILTLRQNRRLFYPHLSHFFPFWLGIMVDMQVVIGIILISLVATAVVFGAFKQMTKPEIDEPVVAVVPDEISSSTEQTDKPVETPEVTETLPPAPEPTPEPDRTPWWALKKPEPEPEPEPVKQYEYFTSPAPAPQTTPQPKPQPVYSPISVASLKSQVQAFDLHLLTGRPVPIVGSENNLVLTSVKSSGSDSEARLEVRQGNSPIRYSLSTGASRPLPQEGSYSYAMEVRSINEDDGSVDVIVRRFPTTRAINVLPASPIYAMPLQYVWINEQVALMIERVDRNRAEISVTTFENGEILRQWTGTYQAGHKIDAPDMKLTVEAVTNDSNYFYNSSNAHWGPHIVTFSAVPK